MSKFIKPLFVTILTLSIFVVGCQKKVTKVEPTPEPPPPVVEVTPPPPPPPEPVQEDIGALLGNLLETIYFDYDKYDLRSESISALEQIASFLNEHPSVRLQAEGHADERGSSEYNMGLGENRAKAIQNYLTSYGISDDRIDVTSYGKERPARPDCYGSDDDCHSANRRVEWQILSE